MGKETARRQHQESWSGFTNIRQTDEVRKRPQGTKEDSPCNSSKQQEDLTITFTRLMTDQQNTGSQTRQSGRETRPASNDSWRPRCCAHGDGRKHHRSKGTGDFTQQPPRSNQTLHRTGTAHAFLPGARGAAYRCTRSTAREAARETGQILEGRFHTKYLLWPQQGGVRSQHRDNGNVHNIVDM